MARQVGLFEPVQQGSRHASKPEATSDVVATYARVLAELISKVNKMEAIRPGSTANALDAMMPCTDAFKAVSKPPQTEAAAATPAMR